MGMYMNLVTISDSNIQCIVEDPPLVWRIIAPEDHEVYEAERAKEFRPTLFTDVGPRSTRTDTSSI